MVKYLCKQSSCAFAATDADFVSERWTLTADKPVVVWPAFNGLYVVVEGDVSEDELELLGCKVTSGAVGMKRLADVDGCRIGKNVDLTYQACLP